MSGRGEKDAGRPKKPYTKPEVKQVHLKPEEAVLGFCKETIGTVGAGGFCLLTCPTLGS